MVQLPLIIENKDKKPDSVKFQVDGKILNELSKQVSSHLFALGELMKNSYDAEATSIDITLNMKNNYLKIEDNGTGISADNIKSLFHIAKSGKEYGRVFNFNLDEKTITRYTQGSKGLGLFCAFKFGDIVQWDTKYEDKPGYSITVNKNNVIELSDITEVNFPLVQGSRIERGTIITITLDPNDKEVEFIYDFFINNNHSKKLVNFFYDKSIEVTLNLINKEGKVEKDFPIKTISKDILNNELLSQKVFDISYSSENNMVIFYKNKKIIHSVKFESKKYNFDINFNINAYSLSSGGTKKINNIFHNSRGDLAPLIYINGVLFNNDQMFDPSITRKIGRDKSLPQLTGFIQITCTDEGLQFNNERTDLVSNIFNSKLRTEIIELNKFIQEEGQKLKRRLENADKKHKDDEQTKDGEQSKDGEQTKDGEQSQDGEQTDKDLINNFKPFINLTKLKPTIRFQDVSDIVNLKDFFKDARDSKGNEIPFEQIKISIDGVISTSPYIQENKSCEKSIRYFFVDQNIVDHKNDPLTCSQPLTLIFIKQDAKFEYQGKKEKLIAPVGYEEYEIKLNGVALLIEQINQLYDNYDEYNMCLASSIRVVFDLSTYRFQQLEKLDLKTNVLEEQVKKIIFFIKEKDDHFRKVSELLDARFRLNKNIFDAELISQKVLVSNLGSHTSISHLTLETIKDIAKYSGYYAQLVDAHCKVKGYIDK